MWKCVKFMNISYRWTFVVRYSTTVVQRILNKFVPFSDQIGQSVNVLCEVLSGLPPVSSIWIPWLSLTCSTHFSLTSRHRSDGYRVKSRAQRGKILHLQTMGFYKNMPRNQRQTLGHLSRSFSLTLPDSQQKKILKFPDFPWLSRTRRSKFSLIFLMVATLCYKVSKDIYIKNLI